MSISLVDTGSLLTVFLVMVGPAKPNKVSKTTGDMQKLLLVMKTIGHKVSFR